MALFDRNRSLPVDALVFCIKKKRKKENDNIGDSQSRKSLTGISIDSTLSARVFGGKAAVLFLFHLALHINVEAEQASRNSSCIH